MRFSRFGEKFTGSVGIYDLMEDMGRALKEGGKIMLGGGNPAHIPEINALWRNRMQEILSTGDEFEKMVANYESPQGNPDFLKATAALLAEEYGWPVAEENIAVVNSSQNAFFQLFNMFCGNEGHDAGSGSHARDLRKILFPQMPEYIGYADQAMERGCYVGNPSRIVETAPKTFKYAVDFDRLAITPDIGAMCVSRPTNPTGNVLTDEEIIRLAAMAEAADIPLLIDNAYGLPFPNILFTEARPIWNRHVIYIMSLSKLGLPSARTGFVIADKKVISALTSMNSVVSLSNVSLGQQLVLPIIQNRKILDLSNNIIRPYYMKKSNQAQSWIREAFPANLDYAIHVSEGALFLWIWFKNLSIPARELYGRLKTRGVVIVPGEYFFFGLDEPWEHAKQCIRLTYSQRDEDVRQGIEILSQEVAGLV